MFADDTLPYVCDKNLGFLLAKLESHSDIATCLSLVKNLSIYGLKLVIIKFGKQ